MIPVLSKVTVRHPATWIKLVSAKRVRLELAPIAASRIPAIIHRVLEGRLLTQTAPPCNRKVDFRNSAVA